MVRDAGTYSLHDFKSKLHGYDNQGNFLLAILTPAGKKAALFSSGRSLPNVTSAQMIPGELDALPDRVSPQVKLLGYIRIGPALHAP